MRLMPKSGISGGILFLVVTLFVNTVAADIQFKVAYADVEFFPYEKRIIKIL